MTPPRGAPPAAPDLAAAQRRTVRVLVLSQATGAVGITIGIATASLLARDLSGSARFAGLTQTGQVLGAAVAAWLLARLMSGRGRRVGLSVGYLLGAAGAALAVTAGAVGSLPLLLVGAVLLGSTTAANNASRYAATDLALPRARGRALSIVVWATTVGAVAGPNLSGPAGRGARALGLPVLTGPFVVGAVAMLVAATVVWVLLRPDPLLLAREAASAADPESASRPRGTSWGRVRRVLGQEPAAGAAIVGLASAHAAMISVMVMTPLHMESGGATLRVIGVVISVHVLGMFAFAPVVGAAADRYGRTPVLAAGGIVLLVSLVLAALAPQGTSWQVFAGLFLLGLGWSLATVAASTLLVDLTPLDARPDVQGAADLAMGVFAALAGAVSGFVVGAFGFPVLASGTAALALLVVLAAVAARRGTRSGATGPDQRGPEGTHPAGGATDVLAQ